MPLARLLAEHVAVLCSTGSDRFPGTDGNRKAVAYVSAELQSLGYGTELLPFEVTGWRYGKASVDIAGRCFDAHPGPFSPPANVTAILTPVSNAVDLSQLESPGSVLLLYGELALAQLTPRNYPWYSIPEHEAILAAIERLQPLAIIAATGKNPGTTGALSPFPLIEDPTFVVPSAYLDEAAGRALLANAGQPATVIIDSEHHPTTGEQLVARRTLAGARRVLVTAHVDSKAGTPGAIDNAAGVAVMLGAARLLKDACLHTTVEFVPFNGEDHATSPGEVVYLEAHPATDDIALVINIDGAGSPGGPTVVSRYNTTPDLDETLDHLLGELAGIAPGEPWFASDHAIFAMRGVPALAFTSHDFERLCEEVTHTPADTPDGVDPAALAAATRFVAAVVTALA